MSPWAQRQVSVERALTAGAVTCTLTLLGKGHGFHNERQNVVLQQYMKDVTCGNNSKSLHIYFTLSTSSARVLKSCSSPEVWSLWGPG